MAGIRARARSEADRREVGAATAGHTGDLLCARLTESIEELRLPFVVYNIGSIVHLDASGLFRLRPGGADFAGRFALRRPRNTEPAMACAAEAGRRFTCAALTDDVIDDAAERFGLVFSAIAAR
ncbi:hypothetical protein [Streptomyces qinzhouensis]|uniref:Uncharacterized protein n=1 Tax=Streptomyces qinzhouensis TaxID=2599401 RepID=A0A5B8JCE7_9ACTN|nr:hypothetical protein [Streptomyces qinzhouensis]QDY79495.1 hypothetical protein FQU76_26520 [Streptomyces qinzhouensis]